MLVMVRCYKRSRRWCSEKKGERKKKDLGGRGEMMKVSEKEGRKERVVWGLWIGELVGVGGRGWGREQGRKGIV